MSVTQMIVYISMLHMDIYSVGDNKFHKRHIRKRGETKNNPNRNNKKKFIKMPLILSTLMAYHLIVFLFP